MDNNNYNDLKQRLVNAGCFERATSHYVLRITAILIAYVGAYFVLLTQPLGLVAVGALIIAAFASVQAGFISHDAGDGGITSNKMLSTGMRQFFLSFVTGVSSSYFHALHKVHHKTMFKGSSKSSDTVSENEYEGKWLKKLVSRDGLLFMVTMVTLRGFTFKFESVKYMLKHANKTAADQLLVGLHVVAWLIVPMMIIGPVAILNYALLTLLIGPYIGTVLVINHAGMVTANRQMHLPKFERVVNTTRNLGDGVWNNLFFGGVNNHIEHHLFPGVPVPNLGEARKITEAFCEERGIKYTKASYFSALIEAKDHFKGLSSQRLVAEALN